MKRILFFIVLFSSGMQAQLFGGNVFFLRQPKCSVLIDMSSNITREWMCHNLGANTNLDPNISAQGIHGNYYQWGQSTAIADASSAAGSVSKWNTTAAINGAWSSPSKTTKDPCPAGFRVPEDSEWNDVNISNVVTRTGTWKDDPTNFGSALHFTSRKSNNQLTLPAAGYRRTTDGILLNRGSSGRYWATSAKGLSTDISFDYKSQSNSQASRLSGFSVRCISEGLVIN